MSEEIIKTLLEDPEAAVALGTLSTTALGTATFAYKTDFGARDMTKKELQEGIDEAYEGVIPRPVQRFKAWKYRNELKSRFDSEDYSDYEFSYLDSID